MGKNRRRISWKERGVATVLLLVLLLGLIPLQAFADDTVKLKVAFCQLEGFFEYDENGKEQGYGVDLLNKITQNSGIRFEYVPAESWEETKEMLLDGTADIRMPATPPVTPSTTLEYGEVPITATSRVLMTLSTRDDLYYEDYETFKQMKVGICSSLYRDLQSEEWMENTGISEDHIVQYGEIEEAKKDLKSGKIDAIVSNIMDMDSSMKLLFQLDSVQNYFSMIIGNPYLRQLDTALQQITNENPDYINELQKKWFPERNKIPLTKEETNYIKDLGAITFAFADGQGFMSRKDTDGDYVGVYPEIAKYISDELGVSYEQIGQDEIKDDQLVVYPDYYFDYENADEQGISITLPYISVQYCVVSKRNANVTDKDSTIAVVENQRVTRDFMADGYDKAQFLDCKNSADCIQAVEKGKAQLAIISSYTAEYYLGMYRYADLSYRLTGYNHQVSMGVSGSKDDMLLIILEKTLNSLDNDTINELYTNAMNEHPTQDILQELVVSKPFEAFGIAAVIGAVAVAAILIGIFASRTKKQNLQLQRATAAKSEFLSRMSHDIRTPLNVIIGMNKLAQENENPEDTQACLEKIDLSSEFLLGLVNDVLDMERVENGKMELHYTPYSEKDFEDYIEAIIRPLCEQKNIVFDFANDSTVNHVILQDKLKINQVYFNLLSNATKYTPEGGVIRFCTKTKELPNQKMSMDVTIADNGIGMSKEFQKHMFDAFTQENQVMSSVSQGTGLGLTIVKHLCDLMGMTIAVESELGKGTTYHLYGEYQLADHAQAEHVQNSLNEEQNDHSILESKTVLVCEDHLLNQEIIRRLLEKKKIIVDLVEDGKQGVEKFEKASPGTYDAILMDIRMPIMDGLEATKVIRSLPRLDAKTIPIIAMTANAYDEDVKASLEAGMMEHLSKPIEPELLYRCLAKYVGAQRKL